MGLFWDDAPAYRRGQSAARILPPVPETTWVTPTEFPSLAGQGPIAIDVETCDPDLRTRGPGAQRGGYICGVAVGTRAGYRQYFPVQHEGGGNLPKEKVFNWLKEQLALDVPKVGAHLLYDLEYMAEAGIEVKGPFYDVQVAEPLLDETQLSYSLENIAKRWLGESKRQEVMTDWLTRAYGADNIKSNIYRAPPAVVGPYAESDVDLPLRIFEQQRKALYEEGLSELFQLESKLIPVLLGMRRRGVQVDISKAEQLKAVMQRRQDIAEAEIKRQTGIKPDIWAAESLAKIFDKAGIEYLRTVKTGAPSFRRLWLEQLNHPIAKLVVEARRMAKFRNTFVEGYILNGHNNGRIQCQFHQLRSDGGGTVSGRFSSSLPNLQNLPIRDPELGPLIRDVFIPEAGMRWYKMDWSQIEFRLAVHFAALMGLRGSNRVVEQYRTDPTTDYHRATAELTGLPRSAAKSINFGIVYGLGVDGLCGQLGVEREEGEILLSQYHAKVPFVRPLYDGVQREARENGEIKTILGRKRRFTTWEKGHTYVRESEMIENKLIHFYDGRMVVDFGWKRAFVHSALNGKLQGSAADIMKQAMVDIFESGVWSELGAPHLTVHDELDGSYEPSPRGLEALAEMRRIMETCVRLEIPMIADMATGESWGKTKS